MSLYLYTDLTHEMSWFIDAMAESVAQTDEGESLWWMARAIYWLGVIG